MGFYTLNNDLSAFPNNPNEGFNNSWLEVDNNANRLLYAQASYVTNFEDLEIILNTADVRIGAVEISDATNNNLRASVASTPAGGALRVLTQDLEAEHDDVSLGDLEGNPVAVNASLSALNVYVTNLSAALATEAKQDVQITLLQRLTSLEADAATFKNQLTGISLLQLLTAKDFATSALQTTQIGWIKALSSTNAGYATSARQDTQIGWLKALSSTNVTILNNISGYALDSNSLKQISLLQNLTSKDFATKTNQDLEISLLQSISGIDYATSSKQNIEISLLQNLTSKDFASANNQLLQISLLQSLTSLEVDNSTATNQIILASLLQNLTSKDFSTSANQSTEITLLRSLTAADDTIIGRLKALSSTNAGYATSANQTTMIGWLKALSSTNTGYSTSAKQDTQITLLSALTSKDFASASNQNLQIALLQNISGIDFATSENQNTEITLLRNLSSLQVSVINPISSVSVVESPNSIITDPEGNIASVNQMSSALQVYITNSLPISITQAINTVVASHGITNVNPLSSHGFYISNTPIVALVVSAVPYSTATLNITNYTLTNFNNNSTGYNTIPHAIYYKWVKNPTLSINPDWVYDNNLRYATFPSSNDPVPKCLASDGSVLFSGLTTSFNSNLNDGLDKFPISGNSTPDIYALVLQTISSSVPIDVWYTVNLTETLVQQLPGNNIINIIMDGGFF